MRLRKQIIGIVTLVAALLAVGGTASAAFPDFSGCNARNLETESCIHVQNRSGNLSINGFNVPLGESLAIRGKVSVAGDGFTFTPPAGTNGFFATPVPVPGGLLGIDWLPGNDVLAITELAGSASSIRIDPFNVTIQMPVKVRLVNILLGMNCHIGTNSRPVNLNLIAGTTNPPPPNRPISGRVGELVPFARGFIVRGSLNVENSFAVPASSTCGLGLGLINAAVNLRLGLPSAAGQNSIEVVNDVALGLP